MSKKDLVQETVKKIESWITKGTYKDTELLPSEGDISIKLGVSRPTVRDAIRTLEVRGFVDRIHGVGIRVNNRSTEVAISFLSEMIQRNGITHKELVEVRRLMEPKAASLAAKMAIDEDLEILKECIETMEKEDSINKKYENADYKFHDTIGRISGNRLLYTIEKSYTPLLFKQIHAANTKGFSKESEHHYHRNIYECIKNGDSDGAYTTTLNHLDDTAKNIN